MIQLSIVQWVGVVLLVTAVVAAVTSTLVLFVFNKKISSVVVNGLVPTSSTSYDNGAKLAVEYVGRGVKAVSWSYSDDGGSTFSAMANGLDGKRYTWTVPSTVYSDQVVVRATDASDAGVRRDSAPFKVVPTIHMTTGAKTLEKYVVPGQLRVRYDTTSGLLTPSNVRLKISTDGISFDDPPASDPFVAVTNERYVQWKVGDDLATQQLHVRITTDNLVSQGYPSELSATSFHSVLMTEDASSSSTGDEGVFSSFDVFGDAELTQIISGGSSISTLTFGEKLYFTFGLSDDDAVPLTARDIEFSYRLALGDAVTTWRPITDLVTEDETTNKYSWVTPSEIGAGSLALRLRQTSSTDKTVPERQVGDILIESHLHVLTTSDGVTPSVTTVGSGDSELRYLLDIYSVELAVYQDTALDGWSLDGTTTDGHSVKYSQRDVDGYEKNDFINVRVTSRLVRVTVHSVGRLSSFVLHHTVGSRTTSTTRVLTGLATL